MRQISSSCATLMYVIVSLSISHRDIVLLGTGYREILLRIVACTAGKVGAVSHMVTSS
jgi:hypothetical protein